MFNTLLKLLTQLPRLVRILVAAVFALAVTGALSPVVDQIYLTYLYTPETAVAPSLVSGGFGIAMYVVGWWLYIGTAYEKPQAHIGILWYFGIGILAMLVVIIWLITGVSAGNLSTTSAFMT